MNLDFLEQIRMAVEEPEEADVELLRDVAAEHAEAVVAVNERLGKISALLRKGLRSEAIQAAERSPRIVDLVGRLDAPEIDAWKELLSGLGLPRPPRLKLDLARDVESAYDEQAGLEGLLKRHRHMALARASLASRLATLRLIQKRDPTNPAWAEDIDAWERARAAQINQEVSKLENNADREGLLALVDELSANWKYEGAPALKKRVQQAADKVQAAWARGEIRGVAGQLNAALAAFDVAAGRAARGRWQELLPLAGVGAGDSLAETAREALAWLEEEDGKERDDAAFRLAIGKLEMAVDRRVSLEELNRRIYAAEKFERELPPLLAQSAQRYRTELEGARRRRVIAASVIALLVLGTAVTLGVMALNKRNLRLQVSEALKQLAAASEAGDFTFARRIHEALTAAARRNPEIIRVWTDLERASDAADQRSADFRRAMDGFLAKGFEDPAMNLLEEARKLASSEAEIREFESAEQSLNVRQRVLLGERDGVARKKLDDFAKDLKNFEEDGDLDSASEGLLKLGMNLKGMEQVASRRTAGRWQGNSQGIVDEIGELKRRIESKLEELNSRRAEMQTIAALRSGSASFSDFQRSLDAALPKLFTPALKEEMSRSRAEVENARVLEEWRKLASRSEWGRLADLAPSEAKVLIDDLEKLDSGKPRFWLSNRAKSSITYLKTVEAIDEDVRRNSLKTIGSLFRTQKWGSCFLVVHKQDLTRYYCSENPVRHGNADGGQISFKYWTNLKDDECQKLDLPVGRVSYSGVSPQSLLALKVCERLEYGGNSHAQMWRDLLRLVLDHKEVSVTGTEGEVYKIDPILVVRMVDAIRAEMVTSVPAFADNEKLDQLLRSIQETGARDADWIALKDAKAERVRNVCRQRLASDLFDIAKLDEALERSVKNIETLSSWREELDFEWAGWMLKWDGEWEAVLSAPGEGPVQLFVLVKGAGDLVRLEPAGTWKDGQWTGCNPSVQQSGRSLYRKK